MRMTIRMAGLGRSALLAAGLLRLVGCDGADPTLPDGSTADGSTGDAAGDAAVRGDPDPEALTWEPPIVLTGGSPTDVYVIENRNIRSDDATVPAVLLDNYQGRVVMRHCNLFGYTTAGTAKAIVASTYGARLDIEDCTFFSRNPVHAHWMPGRSIVAEGFRSLRLVHTSHYGTSGVYLASWVGTAGQPEPTIEMTANYFKNVDGRFSDPSSPTGWKRGNTVDGPDPDFSYAQMLQLNACHDIPRVLVQDNEVLDEAGASRPEDLVSFYASSGTGASPILVEHNLFSGQLVYDAWFDPATSSAYGNNMPDGTPGKQDARGYPSSGGGGLLGDGRGAPVTANPPGRGYLDDPGFLQFNRNTVLGMSNYGLGAAAGHDLTIRGNTMLRSGYVRGIARDVIIPWKHVPVQIQDYSTGGGAAVDDGTGTGTLRVRWYNIDVVDNQFGYTSISPYDGGRSNDGLLLNSPVRASTGNIDLTADPATPFVTRSMEDDAASAHRAAWASDGVLVGSQQPR